MPTGRPALVAVSLTDISALVESASEIEKNEQRFRTLIARSSDVVAVIDADLKITYISGAVEEILGYRDEELLGRAAIDLIHPDDVNEAIEAVVRTLGPPDEYPGNPEPLELRLLHAEGHWVYLEALGTNLIDDSLVGGIVVNLRDISERRRIEATLRDAQVRFEEAFEHAPIGIGMCDVTGSFFRVNPALCRMLGYSRAELLEHSFADLTHPDDLLNSVELHENAYQDVVDSYTIEKRYRRKSGEWIWCRVHITVIRDPEGAPLYSLGQIVDITERRRFEERLAYDATHDNLTDLPLRNLLIDHLELALAGAQRRSMEVAVLFIDLDHFKRVNDSLGHTAGDELLVEVAGRLQASVRAVDTAGRFGGDEFVIVCPDIDGASGALAVAERIRVALEAPFLLRGTEAFVGASVGVVVSRWRGRPRDPPEACRHRRLPRQGTGPEPRRAVRRDPAFGSCNPARHGERVPPRPRERRDADCTINPWCPSAPARSRASRRWSAGTARATAWCSRATSFRSPRTPA